MKRLFAFIVLGFSFAAPVAHASWNRVELPNPLGTDRIGQILCNIAEYTFSLAIVAAVLAFLIAAFYYFTSGGNAQQITKGKKALTYAAAGTAIAILAWGAAMIIATLLSGSPDVTVASC